jgi:hypothetical protein
MEVLFDIQPEPLVETTMTDRENSPAYQMLPGSARRVFAAIERTIGNGSGWALAKRAFEDAVLVTDDASSWLDAARKAAQLPD